MRRVAIVAVLLAALGGTALPAVTVAADPLDDGTAVVTVYPNPVAADDRGEFVVVRPDLAPVTVIDGETTAG